MKSRGEMLFGHEISAKADTKFAFDVDDNPSLRWS